MQMLLNYSCNLIAFNSLIYKLDLRNLFDNDYQLS
nr:MAG TPA: hypothetical protein [Caudoviricetes sp.]